MYGRYQYKQKAADWATRCPMGAACQVISIADSWPPPPSFSTCSILALSIPGTDCTGLKHTVPMGAFKISYTKLNRGRTLPVADIYR